MDISKIEQLIKALGTLREDLNKGKVIDMKSKLKAKRDADPKLIEQKQSQRRISSTRKDPLAGGPDHYPHDRGVSWRGAYARGYQYDKEQQQEDKSYGGGAYGEHRSTLGELKNQPKPKLAKEEDRKIKDCHSCGTEVKASGHIGTQKLPKKFGFDHNLELYNCPSCKTTVSVKVPHEQVKLSKNGQWELG